MNNGWVGASCLSRVAVLAALLVVWVVGCGWLFGGLMVCGLAVWWSLPISFGCWYNAVCATQVCVCVVAFWMVVGLRVFCVG